MAATLLLVGPAVPAANAQGVLVAPSRIDARVQPGSALPSVIVRNDTRQRLSFEVQVLPVRQAATGLPVPIDAPDAVAEFQRVVAVDAKRFELRPGAVRRLRLRVLAAPLRGIAAYGQVVLTGQPLRSERDEATEVAPRLRLGTNLLLRFRGRARLNGRALAVRVEQGRQRRLLVTAAARNTGNLHTDPAPRLTIARDGRVLVRRRFPRGSVLPGADRDYVLEIGRVLPAGTYSARVSMTFGRRASSQRASFTLVGPNELPTARIRVEDLPTPSVEAGEAFKARLEVSNAGTAPADPEGTVALSAAGAARPLRTVPVRFGTVGQGQRVAREVSLPALDKGSYVLEARVSAGGRMVAERAVEFVTRARPGLWARVQDWVAGHLVVVLLAVGLAFGLVVAGFLAYIQRLRSRVAAR